MEPLTFKQQIQVYAHSQVLVMTHGAALINILFMPKVWLSSGAACLDFLLPCCVCLHVASTYLSKWQSPSTLFAE